MYCDWTIWIAFQLVIHKSDEFTNLKIKNRNV